MSGQELSKDEREQLLERIATLEAERNRRLHAEQSMAEARNRVDAELARLHVFQDFMASALQLRDEQALVEAALESVIEAFEFESAVLFSLNTEQGLQLDGQFNLDAIPRQWQPPQIQLPGKAQGLLADSGLEPLSEELGLAEGLYALLKNESDTGIGLLISGNSPAGVGTYTPADESLLSAFATLAGQIAALGINLRLDAKNRQYTQQLQDERNRLEQRVAERTRELQQRELKMADVNRDLNTLTLVNEAVLKSVNEDQLLYEVCRLIVEANGKMMAWVGLADFGPEKRIDVANHYGYHKGYLDGLALTWRPSQRGLGPSGKAIRNGSYTLINDIAGDPDFAPWRDPALERGYGAVISVPLLHQGDAFGVVSVYAEQTNGFDEQNVKTLERVADSLAFGIMALRGEAARKAAEDQRRQSQQHSEQLLASVEDGILATDIDGLIHFGNPASSRLLGIDSESLMERAIFELLTEHDDHSEHPARHAINSGEPLLRQALTLSPPNAASFPAEYSCHPLQENGTVTGAVFVIRDVSRRQQVQDELGRQLSFQQALLDSLAYPLFYTDPEGRYLGLNTAYEAAFDVSAKELVGSLIADQEHIPESIRNDFQKSSDAIPDGPDNPTRQLSLLFSDGRHHRVLYSLEAFKRADGSPAGLIGTFIDISELETDGDTPPADSDIGIDTSLATRDESLSREDIEAAFSAVDRPDSQSPPPPLQGNNS